MPPKGVLREAERRALRLHCISLRVRGAQSKDAAIITSMLQLRFTKFQIAVHLGSLIPFGVLIWDFFGDHLTANPIQEITSRTGKTALVLLVLSLASTPVTTLRRFPHVDPARAYLEKGLDEAAGQALEGAAQAGLPDGPAGHHPLPMAGEIGHSPTAVVWRNRGPVASAPPPHHFH